MPTLVSDAMTPSPQTISAEMNAADAAGLMKSEDVGVLPIVDNGKLVGLVTDRDLVVRVLAARRDPTEVQVGDIATTHTVTIDPDSTLTEAMRLMEENKIRRLPVMKGDELVGILSIGDVAWHGEGTGDVGATLKEISESDSTVSDNP